MVLSLIACSGGSSGAPGYTLTATALYPASVTSGNASTATITVTAAFGYTGSVSLACSVTSDSTPAPKCSFSTTALTISGTSPATSTLTVSTAGSAPGGTSSISVTAADAKNLAPSNGPQTLTLTTVAVIRHVVVIFQENRSTDNLFHLSLIHICKPPSSMHCRRISPSSTRVDSSSL